MIANITNQGQYLKLAERPILGADSTGRGISTHRQKRALVFSVFVEITKSQNLGRGPLIFPDTALNGPAFGIISNGPL